MEWSTEQTMWDEPCALLKDGEKVIVKVYLSPDHDKVRVVFPELYVDEQLKIDAEKHIVDFRRLP